MHTLPGWNGFVGIGTSFSFGRFIKNIGVLFVPAVSFDMFPSAKFRESACGFQKLAFLVGLEAVAWQTGEKDVTGDMPDVNAVEFEFAGGDEVAEQAMPGSH